MLQLDESTPSTFRLFLLQLLRRVISFSRITFFIKLIILIFTSIILHRFLSILVRWVSHMKQSLFIWLSSYTDLYRRSEFCYIFFSKLIQIIWSNGSFGFSFPFFTLPRSHRSWVNEKWQLLWRSHCDVKLWVTKAQLIKKEKYFSKKRLN